jgi:hypothetical protein
VRNIGSSILPTREKREEAGEYEGSMYWNRVRFVITKIGTCGGAM